MPAVEAFLYRVGRFNPAVTVLELRTRLRGVRPFGVLFFYAFIASLTMAITFLMLDLPRRYQTYPSGDTAFGDQTLTVLAMTQLTLLFLIIPAYAAASIALEREKQTLGMVQATLLSPADVVSGKLLVIMAFATMLLLASLPVAAWCLMLGGVSPRQLFFVYTYLFCVALVLTALGMVISAIQRAPMPAVVLTYGILLFVLAGGPGILFAVFEVLSVTRSGSSPTLGVGGASVVLLTLAGVVGWVTYMALRGLLRRFAGLRRGLLGLASPALLALLVAVLAGGAGTALFLTPLCSLEPQGLFLVHPYMALYSILHSSMVDDLLSSGRTRTGGSADLALLAWLGNMAVALVLSVLLWLLAIAAYRWKSRERT
jgi:ABC-type transport system involved in multi-copper enzyme maturation permease subunit